MKRTTWRKSDLVLLVTISFLSGVLVALGLLIFYFKFSTLDPDSEQRHKQIPQIGQMEQTEWQISQQRLTTTTEDDRPIVSDREAEHASTTNNNQLWETTTVIRSALYQYVMKHGQLPKQLTALTQPQPHNYLTAIPNNPINHSNQVSADEQSSIAGWIYQPKPVASQQPSKIKQVVQQALVPNASEGISLEFAPLRLVISKADHQVVLVSGDVVLNRFAVALGKNDATPVGEFSIEKKLVRPNQVYYDSETNPYGTRALGLSDPTYAIHGTNQPEKIGKDVSNGCIRMTNQSIEAMYAKVPLYTPVEIVQKQSFSITDMKSSNESKKILYDQTAYQKEEDRSTFYQWAR